MLCELLSLTQNK